MTASSTDRTPRLLLVIAFMLVGFAALRATRGASAAATWTLAGALLLLAATVAWLQYRSAATTATLREHAARQAARLATFAEAQSRFVDTIAHEIKTPLTIVHNHAELLLRCSDDPAAVRSHARSLADYTLHYSDLFEGFLRLGGPFTVADTSRHVSVHIHDLIIEAVSRCQSMARGRGVTIVPTIEEADSDGAVLETKGNEALLEAMIESLLRHAVVDSPNGSRVEVQVRSTDASIMVHVINHGTVIAPSDLDSMFDWFYQASNPGQPSIGSGSGLTISKRIVEHHRGCVVVKNHCEGGYEFIVTLPRSCGALPPLSRPPHDRHTGTPAAIGEKTLP